MADEYIDILNEDGLKTNTILLKSEAHRLGLWHASVHIWLFTKNEEVLIQKRATIKDTYPDLWDISVAGHIGAGEQPKESAIRELEEELGIVTSYQSLKYIHINKASKKPSKNINDNEFNYIYCCELIQDITTLKLQEEEVAYVKLIPIEELETALANSSEAINYVPHGQNYYDRIFKGIKSWIQ